MLLYTGKAKDLTYKMLLRNWVKQTRPLERLEAADFSKN